MGARRRGARAAATADAYSCTQDRLSARPTLPILGAPMRAHAKRLARCRRCPTVAGTPVVALPRYRSALVLVGQAPGPREGPSGRLFAHTAGKRLFEWIATLGVSEDEFRERVWMAAVLRCFPGRERGGDRVPSPFEIAQCESHLETELKLLRPATVIAVGKLAMERFLPPAPLVECVGRTFAVRYFGLDLEVIPLPHPSGRSTWHGAPGNRRLLDRALTLLGRSAGFRSVFGASVED